MEKEYQNLSGDGYFRVYLPENIVENGKQFPAVIICPGGGYVKISEHEGKSVAERFTKNGYIAFVLNYPVYNNDDVSVIKKDLIVLDELLSMIDSNALKWNIDKEKIILCGFSAGANLCGIYSEWWQSQWLRDVIKKDNCIKPAAVVLCYPLCRLKDLKPVDMLNMPGERFISIVHNAMFGNPYDPELIQKAELTENITDAIPPTFIWTTQYDELIDPIGAIEYAQRLLRKNIPTALHVFTQGHHGLSLADKETACSECDVVPSCAVWFDTMLLWLEDVL